MRAIIDRDKTVLEAMEELYPESARNTLRGFLKDGRVSVDGESVFLPKEMVKKGSTIECQEKRVKKEKCSYYGDKMFHFL